MSSSSSPRVLKRGHKSLASATQKNLQRATTEAMANSYVYDEGQG